MYVHGSKILRLTESKKPHQTQMNRFRDSPASDISHLEWFTRFTRLAKKVKVKYST